MSYGFDANSVPESEASLDFKPIPNGTYDATIEAVEERPTKKVGGSYFNFQWSIDGPEYVNRKIFEMVTWRNANPKAVEIGRQQLKQLCNAIGVKGFDELHEFIGRRCKIKVGIEKRDGFEPKNRIKGYISLAHHSQYGPGGQPVAAGNTFGDDDVPF